MFEPNRLLKNEFYSHIFYFRINHYMGDYKGGKRGLLETKYLY